MKILDDRIAAAHADAEYARTKLRDVDRYRHHHDVERALITVRDELVVLIERAR